MCGQSSFVFGSEALREYHIDSSFHSDPTYKMEAEVQPLVFEHSDDTDDLETPDHAQLVSSIVDWYIAPYKCHIIKKDFNKVEDFPSETQLDNIFTAYSAPFINLSIGKSETHDASLPCCIILKRFIECALAKGKILIFSAGNRNDRTGRLLSIWNLTETQKKQIIFVGGMTPTLDNKQTPRLTSGIAGSKSETPFIWALGKSLIG